MTSNYWNNKGRKGTSNCNTVELQLETDSDYYTVKYMDERFFNEKK